MRKLLILLCVGLIFQSCKKEEGLPGMSSVTIVNAAIDVAVSKAYAAPNKINWSALPASETINFAASRAFGVVAGSNVMMAANSADTSKLVYNGSADFKAGGLNTLFLCGQSGSYEGVFLTNQDFPYYKENVVGIRLINLSPNSPAVKLVLATTPGVNEVSGLSYKQVSNFKTYAAGDAKTDIVFQVRDAATDALLVSYALPSKPVSPYTTVTVAQAMHKNVTLVIKGLIGGTGANAYGIFPVTHY